MQVRRTRGAVLFALVLLTLGLGAAQAQTPQLGPVRWLPGDAQEVPAIQVQDRAALAAGGNGYLAVWQDQRTILQGSPSAPFGTLLGNSRDIYAARLDAAGQVIDRRPIVISNQAHIQSVPKVAWNGESWLVAFLSTRPGDYYHTDLVAVRVAADGRLLDPQPFVINAQTDNNTPSNLAVSSDGTGWAVVWEEFSASGVRGVEGTYVSRDGVVANPNGKPIWFDTSNTYAQDVTLAFASDRYLITWVTANGLMGLRATAGLDRIDAAPITISPSGRRPSVTSDGVDFFVVWHGGLILGARVSRTGGVLDPGGIQLSTPSDFGSDTPYVAWDGTAYAVVWSQAVSLGGQDIHWRRLGRDGRPLGTAVPLAAHTLFEARPVVASRGDGVAQALWEVGLDLSDIYAGRIAADGTVTTPVPVSIDRPRQSAARLASHSAGHLAVFLDDVSGQTRVMAQRLDAAGNAIDAEPVLVASGAEGTLARPDVAWNGSVYLVVWNGPEGILGRRLSASGAPAEPAKVILADPKYSMPAVGALGGDFLVVGSLFQKYSTVWQNWLQGVRVSGAGTVLDAPFVIRGGVERMPRVAGLGGNWLVVWESQGNYNSSYSSILGAFVSPAGSPGVPFSFHLSGSACSLGCGDDPDVAVQGDEALVVWSDNAAYNNAKIDARRIKADGTFPGNEIEVVQAAGDQFKPAVTGDGAGGWVVSWVDYRTTTPVQQLRGDIYLSRLDTAGAVLNPGGIQVSSGPLPEEQPELAPVPGSAGSFLLAYSAIDPLAPVNYRIALRTGSSGSTPPPPPPAAFTFALNPAAVTGGKASTGTVTLSAPAPVGGAKVTLASANTAVATVPLSVTVAEGTTTRTFTVSTRTVTTATPVAVSATWGGSTQTATLTVQPPVLSGLTLTPASFAGGCQSSTGKVTLTGAAPAGGVVVQLADTNPAAAVPPSVTVPAGATSAIFPITAPAVSAPQTGSVTASYGGVSKASTLTVRPIGPLSVGLSSNPVVGPNPVTGTVTLDCAAPAGGFVVALSSSNTAVARTGTSVTVPAGSTSATFPVTTVDVATVGTAYIKATANGVSKSARLTVNP